MSCDVEDDDLAQRLVSWSAGGVLLVAVEELTSEKRTRQEPAVEFARGGCVGQP